MYLIDLPLTLPCPKTMITWPICYCYSCLCLYCCYCSFEGSQISALISKNNYNENSTQHLQLAKQFPGFHGIGNKFKLENGEILNCSSGWHTRTLLD